jgi:CzcA family heavy metal efflux pump
MLNHVINWSLKNQLLVLLLSLMLVGFGLRSAAVTAIDVFPDFSPVQVEVLTEAPGYAPEEVETAVHLPLEVPLGGTAGAKKVRSISTVGLSVITIIFEDGMNIFKARQLVAEKLLEARGKLPGGFREPVLAPIATITGDILKVGFISAGETSSMDLRTLADWTIRPRLRSVPGISNVVTYGGQVKQFQVLVDPARLASYQLSLDDVVKAAGASTTNAAGGILRTSDREYLIRGLGRAHDAESLGRAVVAVRKNTPVTLSQVATVAVGPALQMGDAVIDGKTGLLFNVVKQPWANTLETTYAVEKALKELSAALPGDVQSITLFRQADFIEVAVRNVLEALVLGGVFVLAVLIVFLRNWKAAFISMTAIPLSLLASLIVLRLEGGTINTMTLAGLAIAIGEVVDDAIIDVENIFRRLRENALSGVKKSAMEVVFDASCEIRGSVVYATYIVALVFLPVFYLGGLEGKIFTPLALSYIVAIMSSLAVALTVTPVMCYFLLGETTKLHHGETKATAWLKERYARLLTLSLARPKLVIAAAAALFLLSLAPLLFVGREFLPEFDEGNVVVAVTAPPGTSLSATRQIGLTVTGEFARQPDFLSSAQRAGRAEGSDDYGGSHFSEIDLRLSPAAGDKQALLKDVRVLLSQVPGIVANVGSYMAHRMDHALSGINAAIAIKVFGPDMAVLHEKAREVESIVKAVRGIEDAQVEQIVPIPQVSIEIVRPAAARYGLQIGDVARTIETAFKGKAVAQVVEGQKTFDLVVWFKPEARDNIETIKNTLLDTPAGVKVPLHSVASVFWGTSPNTIRHEALSRLVVVQANVAGRDLGGTVNDIRERVKQQVSLPSGYYVVYGGQFEAQEEATQQLVLLSALSCAGIFLLLCIVFRSGFAAALVMCNLPLCLIGGIWAVVLSGGVLSIGSLVGFITLFGVSTRNGIMLVSHFNHLLSSGSSLKDALWQGSMDRLSPVLMTALCAALGVLPIALLGGAGRELEQPLAVVILGGMFSSTALTLAVIPALFQLFGKKALRGAS